MIWTGNEEVFKTYVKGNPNGDGKSPAGKVKGKDHISTFEEAEKNSCFGGILNEGIIDISFDLKEMSDSFWDMAEANGWNCLILENPDNGHMHSFWRNDGKKIKQMSGKDQKLAVGLTADIHGGSTYIPLRVHGSDRFPPSFEPDVIDEVPEELLPINTSSSPFGMAEGGRNSTLSSMTKNLIYNTRFTKDQIKRIITNTNAFVFKESLPDGEVEVILRDETFVNMEERKLNTVNAAELFHMDVKPTEFIVNGLIPVGLSLLASPPKYGKSWMVLYIAISVAEGTDFLGFTTNKCDVLYLALEDRKNRLKERMLKLTGGKAFPAGLEIAIDAKPLGDGFIEHLEDFLKDHPETKLVIVDTFIKIRGIPNGKESSYAVDSREAGILKKFADQHSIAILIVTHTRKWIDPNDPFANVTGTFGVVGVADDMIVLSKEKREDVLTKMSVTGRDVSYEDYPIVFNSDSGKWVRQGDSYELVKAKTEIDEKWAEYHVGNIRKTILKLLEENDGIWQGRCNVILNKSREYGTPINLSSTGLGKELLKISNFLYNDKIVHTEMPQGNSGKKHKLERIS